MMKKKSISEKLDYMMYKQLDQRFCRLQGVSRLGVEKWVFVDDEFVALAHRVNENPIFSTIIRHNLQKLSKIQRLIGETFKESYFNSILE